MNDREMSERLGSPVCADDCPICRTCGDRMTLQEAAAERAKPRTIFGPHVVPGKKLGEIGNVNPPGKALHASEGKIPLQLLPAGPEEAEAWAWGYGAWKYGRGNYLKGMPWSELYGSARRHLSKWVQGETFDPDAEKPRPDGKIYGHRIRHLAFAICNLKMLLDYELRGGRYLEDDDRGIQ